MASPTIPFPYLPTGLADSAKTGQNFEAISKYLRDVNGIITIDWTNLAVTRPSQPCFLAVMNSDVLDVTGDGTHYTIVFGNEVFDQGGDFSSTTFTAPVTGKYLLTASAMFYHITAAVTDLQLKIVTSNQPHRNYRTAGGIIRDFLSMNVSVLADMDAGDTAFVQATAFGTTKTIDLYATDPVFGSFSGSLIN
jgi:hypothetical protein